MHSILTLNHHKLVFNLHYCNTEIRFDKAEINLTFLVGIFKREGFKS